MPSINKTHSIAVYVTYRGLESGSRTTANTGQPWLLFYDEMVNIGGALLYSFRFGLVCRSNRAFTAGWHFTNGDPVTTFSTSVDIFGPMPFLQIRTDQGAVPSIAQLALTQSIEPDYTNSSGLFTCRLNGSEEGGSIPVGLYLRGGGEGYVAQFRAITLDPVADPGFGKGGFMRMCTVATI